MADGAGAASAAWALAALLAVAALAGASARGRVAAPQRSIWTWFTLAMGAALAATVARQVASSEREEALAAGIGLLFYPAVIAGSVVASRSPAPRAVRAGDVLDRALLFSAAATVFLAVATRTAAVSSLVLDPSLSAQRPLASALAALTVSLIGAQYLADDEPVESGVAITTAAIIFMAVGDLLLELTGAWVRWADAWWAIGALGMTVGALKAGRVDPVAHGTRRRGAPSPIPFVATGVLLIALIADAMSSEAPGADVLAIGAAITVTLGLVRQWLALRQNARLARARMEAERERLAADRRRRESERLDALGRMAQGVAHDFNSLLTGIIQNAELALDDLHDPALAAESLRHVKQSAVTAGVITGHLLAFARTGTMSLHPVDVRNAVGTHLDAMRASIPANVRLDADLCDGPVHVRSAGGFTEQVLGNLVRNAVDAMPDGGALRVALTLADDHVILSVADSGQGMDETTRARLFEPFFSTKGVRGTGLGLASSWGLMRQCGGDILVETMQGRGTTFHARWPRADRLGDS